MHSQWLLRYRPILIGLLFFLGVTSGFGQPDPTPAKRSYTCLPIPQGAAPSVDGKLDDAIWQTGTWETNFVQRQPNENASPTVQTAFKILFDTKYLYVGIRNYDPAPELINSRMSRRDGNEGDWVEVMLDCNGDLRSAFSLTVTAAGVKGDKVISLNGANEDTYWNPIWNAKSHIDSAGWAAEMKIPFSQLRFGQVKNKIWGLQVRRNLFRLQETSVWQRIPLDATGWVSEFGEFEGLSELTTKKQFEIQPYVTTSLQTVNKNPANPYQSAHKKRVNAGLDGKIGLTNDLILDFTFNPDFGQVEADPSAIALDGFQLFFAEQRPFFIENKEILNYQFSTPITGSNHNSDNLFYSRRIGGKPHGSVTTEAGEYANVPARTTILGAAKFGGKNQKGLSIGVLETLTSQETAEISDGSTTRQLPVEPMTNYFVGRVQQDLNNKNTFLGGILTSTIRSASPPLDSLLHRTATTAGLDFLHQWNNRAYYFGSNFVMSHVEGKAPAILRTQQSIPHLFQKAGADHVRIDSQRTSLTGTGGDIKIGKAGNGNFTFESGFTWRSPELELNDMGFMREADVIFHYANLKYKWLKPFSVFRNAAFTYQHWVFTDFGGKVNYIDWDTELRGVFNNNWNATFGFYSQPYIYSRTLLQGGPRIKLPDQYGFWWGAGTDPRKKLSASFTGWNKMGNADSQILLQNGLDITYRPLNKLNFTLSPNFTLQNHRLQYVDQAEFEGEARFITARLDQKTLRIAMRVNYALTPNLTIQYYGQPFISTGKYDDFSFVQHPLAHTQAEQLVFYDAEQLSSGSDPTLFQIDENRDQKEDYSFRNPDFSVAQFRSNLVIRYEYKPGSEIFLVWSQSLDTYGDPQSRFREEVNAQLLRNPPLNNFILKVTYRFY